MLLLVSNQYRDTYKYRRKLYSFGLRYENGKWRLNTNDADTESTVRSFCRRKHLHFESIADKYVRSFDYRRNFIKQYKCKDGKYYRCAYCGKKITSEKMTVDHIISVDKVQHSGYYRLLMRLLGIRNINDIQNLTPACERCNKRKGKRVRGYLIKGLSGQTYSGVIIRRVVKFFLAVVFIITVALLLKHYFSNQVNEVFSYFMTNLGIN